MAWHGRLSLRFRRDGERSIVFDRHEGPLRVLKSLHPEPGVCHSVLVHPPGGIVGGDELELEVDVEAGAHALVTTPGATRFYRSLGEPAQQSLRARVATGGRLEWLPLETLAYSGCIAASRLRLELAPGAEAMAWDVLALGLPASDLPFVRGRFRQEIDVAGRWLERGTVDGGDTRLLDSPLGWDGRRVLATLWFAAGEAIERERCDALVDAARAAAGEDDKLASHAGTTAVDPAVVVVRVLARAVEPAMALLGRIRREWRRIAWALDAPPPRVWRT